MMIRLFQQVNIQRPEIKHRTVGTVMTSQKGIPHPGRKKSSQPMHGNIFSTQLRSIRERDEDLEDNLTAFRQRLSPAYSSGNSTHRSQLSSRTSRPTIDKQTLDLRLKLERKMVQAKLKLQQLKSGLKLHQRTKTKIIQTSQSQRLSRSKERSLKTLAVRTAPL